MKNKYNLIIIAAAIGITFLYNVLTLNETTTVAENKKPVFFNRMPTNVKKIRQHININIDYEKLPARNEIRLIGRVNAAHLKSEIIEYKWTLKDNLSLKSGSRTGRIDLRETNEIVLDVIIKNMNKKVNVRLEASIPDKKIKIGSTQSFTYDPTNEDQSSEKMEAQTKALGETLTKQEALEKELFAPRKISTQQ